MQLHTVVNMFGADLQRRYHEKIHKITLHGGFNCPNRDGTLGRGGCTFCNVSSFADEQTQYHSPLKNKLHYKLKILTAHTVILLIFKPIPVLMPK